MYAINTFTVGQTPKSDIPPNIAPKIVTPENYLQIWDSSATLIGQLATVPTFGAMLGGIPLSGAYPFFKEGGAPTEIEFEVTGGREVAPPIVPNAGKLFSQDVKNLLETRKGLRI